MSRKKKGSEAIEKCKQESYEIEREGKNPDKRHFRLNSSAPAWVVFMGHCALDLPFQFSASMGNNLLTLPPQRVGLGFIITIFGKQWYGGIIMVLVVNCPLVISECSG